MDEEPVEILVRMSESGEIDPWNIDIVEVTDRFLNELDRMHKLDLRVSGRTLFYASLLLRMKSEVLEESGESPDEELSDDFADDLLFGGDDYTFGDIAEPVDRLEREIQRRIKRKSHRKRPVTLYELIKELKTAEKMQIRGQKRKKAEPLVFFEADDVISVAHEEDFKDETDYVYSSFEKVCGASGETTLSSLCHEVKMDQRSVYLPLLFLMLEGKLMIFQDEFFGEIKISGWSPDKFEEN
ncbi:segregation/condensation protein A [Methanoplanus limicola]|uniref:Condensin subunit ScpA n=1 Tax=Methanoplanus limicola DSM 2279 TaxID=937775 RepID=H1YWC4_9EURY|nr:ScpA family protein [Methanoplanus limicola]EHQ34846.1 condensin subunit ScpA [Methanoplanus limicola DSM 2279]